MAELCTGNKIYCNGKMVKALVLLLLAGLSVALFNLFPIKSYLQPEVVEAAVRSAGLWGPAVFTLCCVFGICLFVPATAFLGLAVALFGFYRGFFCLWVAAMGAASLSFLISRTLGRDFTARVIGNRMVKYDDLIERNGFAAVLYLRLMCFPFAVLNYGMGLSRVLFWDYFLATALGEAVTIFVIAFFLETLKGIWLSGDWGGLLSLKFALSLGLVAFSLLIPKIVGRVKRNRAKTVSGPLEAEAAGLAKISGLN